METPTEEEIERKVKETLREKCVCIPMGKRGCSLKQFCELIREGLTNMEKKKIRIILEKVGVEVVQQRCGYRLVTWHIIP